MLSFCTVSWPFSVYSSFSSSVSRQYHRQLELDYYIELLKMWSICSLWRSDRDGMHAAEQQKEEEKNIQRKDEHFLRWQQQRQI